MDIRMYISPAVTDSFLLRLLRDLSQLDFVNVSNEYRASINRFSSELTDALDQKSKVDEEIWRKDAATLFEKLGDIEKPATRSTRAREEGTYVEDLETLMGIIKMNEHQAINESIVSTLRSLKEFAERQVFVPADFFELPVVPLQRLVDSSSPSQSAMDELKVRFDVGRSLSPPNARPLLDGVWVSVLKEHQLFRLDCCIALFSEGDHALESRDFHAFAELKEMMEILETNLGVDLSYEAKVRNPGFEIVSSQVAKTGSVEGPSL